MDQKLYWKYIFSAVLGCFLGWCGCVVLWSEQARQELWLCSSSAINSGQNHKSSAAHPNWSNADCRKVQCPFWADIWYPWDFQRGDTMEILKIHIITHLGYKFSWYPSTAMQRTTPNFLAVSRVVLAFKQPHLQFWEIKYCLPSVQGIITITKKYLG